MKLIRLLFFCCIGLLYTGNVTCFPRNVTRLASQLGHLMVSPSWMLNPLKRGLLTSAANTKALVLVPGTQESTKLSTRPTNEPEVDVLNYHKRCLEFYKEELKKKEQMIKLLRKEWLSTRVEADTAKDAAKTVFMANEVQRGRLALKAAEKEKEHALTLETLKESFSQSSGQERQHYEQKLEEEYRQYRRGMISAAMAVILGGITGLAIRGIEERIRCK